MRIDKIFAHWHLAIAMTSLLFIYLFIYLFIHLFIFGSLLGTEHCQRKSSKNEIGINLDIVNNRKLTKILQFIRISTL